MFLEEIRFLSFNFLLILTKVRSIHQIIVNKQTKPYLFFYLAKNVFFKRNMGPINEFKHTVQVFI